MSDLWHYTFRISTRGTIDERKAFNRLIAEVKDVLIMGSYTSEPHVETPESAEFIARMTALVEKRRVAEEGE